MFERLDVYPLTTCENTKNIAYSQKKTLILQEK